MILKISDEERLLTPDISKYMHMAADALIKKEFKDVLKHYDTDALPLEADITVVSRDEIKDLNSRYRGIDRVTDVLSFPQHEGLNDIYAAIEELLEDDDEAIDDEASGGGDVPGEEDAEARRIPLGDVVICYEKAKEQSKEFGTTPEREIVYLFVHSLLHLLGYDHMEERDEEEMRAHEEAIMDDIGLPRTSRDKEYRELYRAAKEVLYAAYAPYSGFRVGAALLVEGGQVFTGVNVENSSYGATICAERSAAVKAVAAGYTDFTAIAIVSDDGAVNPCGICRQFLSEFCKDMDIITGDDEDHLEERKLSDLLPRTFRL